MPEKGRDGRFRGMRARGGVEGDLTWQEGRATLAVLRASREGTHTLRPPAGQRVAGVRMGGAVVPFKTDGDEAVLTVTAGAVYEVRFEPERSASTRGR